MSKERLEKLEKLKEFLLSNFVDENGDLDISGLDFSDFDGEVDIGHMKIKGDLWQVGNQVKGNLYQDLQVVGENLHQDDHLVSGDLFQGYKSVDGKVFQSKKRIDRYYWNGYLGSYEIIMFEYDEVKEVLTLYTYGDIRKIVDLSYADSHVKLETFTDEEINEHLLETYEEYVYKGIIERITNGIDAVIEKHNIPSNVKLTSDEVGILKNIDKKYKYIARDNRSDNNGALTVFEKEPEKNNHNEYVSRNDEGWKYLYADLYHLFQNITFESGAHLIADLIKENENGL